MVRAVKVVRALAGRDFRARYRRTFLGPLWALLVPVLLTVVFTVVRTRVRIDVGDVPYVLFAYVGAHTWTLLATGILRGGPSVVANGGIVRKVALPLEVFPLSAMVLALVDYGIGCVILAVLLLQYGVALTWAVVWLAPLMVLLLVLTFAWVLVVAALGTFRRDVLFGVGVLLPVAMLGSPVFYAGPPGGGWSYQYLNPMVGILGGFRNVLLDGRPPEPLPILASLGVTLLILAISWPLFRRVGRYFADVL